MTSEIEVEILKAQGINNVLSLLRAKDLYSIFKIDCEKLDDLKNRACLKLKNGEYLVRPAIRENLDYCINEFKKRLPEQQQQRQQEQLSQTKHHQEDPITQQNSFMNTFINNLTDNMNRSKFRYQYNTHVRRFASAVYGLGGRNLYQFLRLNLPGAFPSIPTLESYNNEYCTRIEEGEFRFHQLKNYADKTNCSFVYASEDCTGVIRKIQYGIETNSFVGFCPHLVNGLPSIRQYQTDSFSELEDWFETVNQSTLVNIHTMQLISSTTPPPFLLSSFGTDNKADSLSILFRWLYVYEKCYNDNIRVIGFSSDADPKYLRAMRLIMGYFAELPNINLLDKDDIFAVQIPKSWSSWFFLRPKQLFVCFQDGTHVATKLRNRLLSTSASLIMGSYQVSAKHLQDLIENRSKLNHGLVLSDLCVKDRQNYASCLKISSENVLNMLNQDEELSATHCYLTILQFTTLAYVDKTTNLLNRLFYAWSTVFISRLWWMWLRYEYVIKTESTTRQNRRPTLKMIEEHFMTYPAFYSIELNAHVLTFIILLVLNKKLPVESTNIFLFSSQPCENMFRSARALNGPNSSMTNFTLQQFLSKTRKISILNEIKSLEEINADMNTIKFPKHHKQNQHSSFSSTSTNVNDITVDQIEETIYNAYEYAKSLADKLKMSSLLKKNNVFKRNNLCSSMRDDLEEMIYVTDCSEMESDDEDDNNDCLNEEGTTDSTASNNNSDNEDEHIDEEVDDEISKKSSYNGMRIYSTVADEHKNMFFKININGNVKYMHKQTAAWYLTKNNNHLSSDRLVRVQKMNKQE